jgi:hypothetical protein
LLHVLGLVQRPMPPAVASRCCRCRFLQLACACGTTGWRMVSCLKWAATLPQQEKKNSLVVQRRRVNVAWYVQ